MMNIELKGYVYKDRLSTNKYPFNKRNEISQKIYQISQKINPIILKDGY